MDMIKYYRNIIFNGDNIIRIYNATLQDKSAYI